MYQTTIDQFYDFLLAQHHGRTTIRGYIRTISGLEEPPDTKNPAMLLKYVDNALQEKKELLSHSNFVTARASLGLFFFMMTGLQIKDFRKQCMALDQYDSLVRQYASYCRDFLNLTDAVIEASVRETKLFLRATVQDLGCVVWSSITAAAVTAYLAKERSNLCTSSIGVTVTAIRRFFRFLQHNDLMVHASILKLPLAVPNWNKNSRLPITLTKENQAQLACHVFPDTPAGRRDRAILLCFAELGLRCNEVANLQLEDIEWNRGTIIIRNTKNHSGRELPVSTKLGKALEDYVMHSRPQTLGGELFYKSRRQMSGPATTETVRSVVRRLYSKNGINGWHVGTHALRRTFGSHLYKAGNSLKTVADLLGHMSVSATKAYARIDIEHLRDVASSWPSRGDMT